MKIEKYVEIVFFALHCLFIVIDFILHYRTGKKISGFCKDCDEPIYENEEHKCNQLKDKIISINKKYLDTLDVTTLEGLLVSMLNKDKELDNGN